jgi:1-acyl-sn-glycerol-3-phosphate acyltransferase
VILYQLVRLLLLGLNKAFFRVTFEGTENVPADGAFILAPVHRSFLDFALVSGVTGRRMRYMGKDSLFTFKPFGAFISALGAFPVHRGAADREALRRSVEVISGGEPLVLFPEGTRRSGPVVEELFDGAAYVAGRTQVPIVPVGIGGSERALQKGKKLPRPVKVHIIVGKPLPPPGDGQGGRVPRRAVHERTAELQAEVQRLFDEAQRKAGVVD